MLSRWVLSLPLVLLAVPQAWGIGMGVLALLSAWEYGFLTCLFVQAADHWSSLRSSMNAGEKLDQARRVSGGSWRSKSRPPEMNLTKPIGGGVFREIPEGWPGYDRLPDPIRERLRALCERRNICPDAEVEAIDAEILRLLYPYMELRYEEGAGCGSLFNVDARPDRGIFLRRERFY